MTLENESGAATSFDDIVAETVAEMTEEAPAPAPPEEEQQETPVAPEPKEEEAPAPTEEEEPEEEEASPEEEETPAEPEEEETTVDSILNSFKGDKEKLESLLRLIADDADIAEIPAVKALLGKERQSATDKTRNELEREKLQQQAVQAVLAEGQRAVTDVQAMIDTMEADLEKFLSTGEGEVKVPDKSVIEEKFNTFANAAVHAYHNEQFIPLGELIYSLPELQQTTEAQQELLAQAAGKSPAEWLGLHLGVARENLWNLALASAEQQRQQEIVDRTSVLSEAHKTELEKITKKHEAALEKAVEKAKNDTRLEVLAEQASQGTPPRSPSKEPTIVVEAEDDATTIEDIWAASKRNLEKQHAGAGV